jgi:Outer membrane efflux protein
MIVHIFLILLGVIAACIAGPFLQPPYCLADSSVELHLRDAIEAAARQAHSKAAGSRLEVAIAEQENQEIFGTFYAPRFELTSYGGLVPGAKGDLMTEDSNVNEDLGPFFKIDLKAVQPLYSFGKYASAKGAGEKNLEMKQALAKEAKNDLDLEVAKVFFGVVAGRDGTEVSDNSIFRSD